MATFKENRERHEALKAELAPLVEKARREMQATRNRLLGKSTRAATQSDPAKTLDDIEVRQFERRVIAAGLNPDEYHTMEELEEAERKVKVASSMGRVRKRVARKAAATVARRKEIRAAAITSITVTTPPTGSLQQVRRQWDGIVNSYKARGMNGIQAARMANEKHPEVRQQLVALANQ